MRLGAILDEEQAMAVANVPQGGQVRGLPIKVDGDDRPCPWPDRLFGRNRIDGIPGEFDIDQNRRRARHFDSSDRGNRRVRDGDDFVSLADAQSPQGEVQRVGSAVHANAMPNADICGELRLETLNDRAQHVSRLIEDGLNGGIDLRLVGLVRGHRIGGVDGFVDQGLHATRLSLKRPQYHGAKTGEWCICRPETDCSWDLAQKPVDSP